MLAAVAKYVRENPDKAASNSAAALANLALKTSFPCVKKGAH
jgi:DNA-binding MurR/RpiR family transcriptional regulator